MRIIQITDLHTGPEGAYPFDIDVRQNFLKILEKIQEAAPDLVVLTGDLCLHTGDHNIYQWQKEHLDDLNIPYEVIAGNHDDSTQLASVFNKTSDLHNKELYYRKDFGGKTCIFLDSAVARLSATQYQFLQQSLDQTELPVVIFIHHPPIFGGVAFMELKYAMTGREQFQKIIMDYGKPVSIFCGHYHIEKTVAYKNMTMQITPSCYVQIDGKAEDFKEDHRAIAYREILFSKDMVISEVRYFAGINQSKQTG